MDSDTSELAAIDKECAVLQVPATSAPSQTQNPLQWPRLNDFFSAFFAFLNALQSKLDRIQSNSKTLQSEADLIEKQVVCLESRATRWRVDVPRNQLTPAQLVLSKETFSKAVQDCAATIKNTNSNIARLNRTQQHSTYSDYLKVIRLGDMK
jgi:hypothetical protein